MRRLSIELSRESISAALREIEGYGASLPAKVERMLSRLCESGIAAAVLVVPQDTGELKGSIRLERRGPGDYIVVADCGYAAFVEFGTGVVGKGTYSGDLPAGWGYDERRTPSAHDQSDPSYWYYYDRDGNLCRTRGRPASGFMLSATEAMRRDAIKIAREVFAR